MTMLKLATLSLALLAVPATAQSLGDTHEMRWTPSGKLPAVTYHPLKRGCGQRAEPIHLAGKTQFHAPKAQASCDTNVAAVDRQKPTAPIAGTN